MILDLAGLQISVPEFIWTIISFFLFMFLLNKFLFKPVMSFMDERKARIDAGLEEGKKANAALKENEARLAKELAEKGGEARNVISEARSEAEKAKSETSALPMQRPKSCIRMFASALRSRRMRPSKSLTEACRSL